MCVVAIDGRWIGVPLCKILYDFELVCCIRLKPDSSSGCEGVRSRLEVTRIGTPIIHISRQRDGWYACLTIDDSISGFGST